MGFRTLDAHYLMTWIEGTINRQINRDKASLKRLRRLPCARIDPETGRHTMEYRDKKSWLEYEIKRGQDAKQWLKVLDKFIYGPHRVKR